MASKPDPKDFFISGQSGATIVRLPGSIQGYDLALEELTDCTVYLLDHAAQITVDYCTNTRFVIGPVDGPVFLRNCTGCTVTVACRQLRTRECVDCDVYLYCATKSPIIESSSRMRFHPFDAAWPGLTAQFAAAKLNPAVNHNDLIYDFTANDSTIPQPHSTVIKEVPPLRMLKCFSNGQQIDGAIDDTPLAATVAYPSRVEERVEKNTDNVATTAASAEPATAAPAVMVSFGSGSKPMESFGSGSKKMESFGSASAKSDAPAPKVMESFGSSSLAKPMESFGSGSIKAAAAAASQPAKMESFGSQSIKAAETAPPAAAAEFEEGVAPSIPSEPLAPVPTAAEEAPAEAPAAAEAAKSDVDVASAAASDAAVPAAPVDASVVAAPSAAADADEKVIVKEASFSIQTSAEDASRALFALAGVEYKPAKPAAPAASAAPAPAAAASPEPAAPVSAEDEEARLAAWMSQTPGMLSSGVLPPEQAAQEARVAAFEARRLEGIEQRRKQAEEQAAAAKAQASETMKEFYAQREKELAERRKANNSQRSSTTPTQSAPHTRRDRSEQEDDAAAADELAAAAAAAGGRPDTLPDALMAALHASSSSAAAASPATAAASSAVSLESGWSSVLSLLPPGAVAKHSPAEIARMKALYMQLKSGLDKQRAAGAADAEAAARRQRKEEKKQRKKEKKKRKRAKRREQRKATAAALAAAVIAAGGQPPPPLPDSDSSSSSSDSSSSDED